MQYKHNLIYTQIYTKLWSVYGILGTHNTLPVELNIGVILENHKMHVLP